jgi:acyl carrier protein
LESKKSANMNIRSEITTQFKQVAQEQGMQLAPLTDDLALLDSGLDSLCFAMVVARLEGQLEVDPFSASEDAVFPVTFGEFVRFYEHATK